MFLATSLRSFFLSVGQKSTLAAQLREPEFGFQNPPKSGVTQTPVSLPALVPAFAYTGVHILTQTQVHT